MVVSGRVIPKPEFSGDFERILLLSHIVNVGTYTIHGFYGNHFDLVGGFKPFEKHDRQIGSFPQVGVKIQTI